MIQNIALGVLLVKFLTNYCVTPLTLELSAGKYSINSKTAHACEEEILNLQCDQNQLIRIVRSNYGRTRDTICTRNLNKDWNFNCKSSSSLLIVGTQCNGFQKCTVNASNSVFGDPCSHTEKYLEVDYECHIKQFYELEPQKKALACEHNPIHLNCLSGTVIQIVNANYGRTDDVTCAKNQPNLNCVQQYSKQIVEERCNFKSDCTLSTSNTVFGDPCEGTNKYLEVSYKCIVAYETDLEKKAVACEWQPVTLKCTIGTVIEIIRANYGRTDAITCSLNQKNNNCIQRDSKEIVEKRCNFKNECTLNAANNIFGDPCSGTAKYLEVFYKCVDIHDLRSQKKAVACEGQTTDLTCGTGKSILIIRANYGRTDATTCSQNQKNVKCMQSNTKNIVDERCNLKSKCSLSAINGFFGDPCIGIEKYLEVFYKCEDPFEEGFAVEIPQQMVRNNELAENTVCGFQTAHNRIWGGIQTKIGEFPWMVLLKYKYKKNKNDAGFRCAGTLINKRYVLTAAHCIDGSSQEITFGSIVRLGEHDMGNDIDCIQSTTECADPPLDVGVSKTITHEYYNARKGDNDIGLLRLINDIVFTAFVRPICLPPSNLPAPMDGVLMTVAGWGATENVTRSSIKLKINIPIVKNPTCYKKMISHGIRITDSQVCAGGVEGVDACKGDSGGPLMATDSTFLNLQWYQEGIVSRGIDCGHKGFPGIYIRVSKYIQWILSKLEE